ncbi:hypothetical protein BKA66DRAFT_525956 [Pyrenochaeta sp. MPI-SDFR-AT-0127]|nr:hypothetical protein BKA66DRAFT_525956 [Pyrenochaeta sp. MPI-SDFR-AT-0127]
MDAPPGIPTPTSNCSSFEVLDIIGDEMVQTMPDTPDVAIIGLSCRTAGGNNTPEKLWDFLLDKKHASGEIPSQRWEPWLRRDPRNAKILRDIIHKGYFLDDLENFDAAFFGISPKEAELMDPHQRLGLELAWEALENAGIDPRNLAGSDTAVYMGVDSDDYSRMLLEDLPNIEAWSGIGTAYHGIPNRISYHLDLQGPSTAVDAACASSLIAIHLARQAIVSGESTTAICGGVNVICAPGLTHMLQKAGALSPDGVCRSFDDQACGYARGEGGAMVILKRLSAAIEDGDNILAVLKGTASAQDGKTNGIMAPNTKAQEMVARQALLRAGDIDPLTIGYVEAHATSTSLGDPTEISAIANVYGTGRAKDTPCFVGSIKPNVGHLEAAAGAIGFVKAVLAVHNAELAPQTLLGTLNTKIDWDGCGLEVVREKRPWPQASDLRRAAVCCYGYGGSVCHAIIEQAPVRRPYEQHHEREETRQALVPLMISAHQEKRLAGHASLMAKWLSTDGRTQDLAAIARTLSQRRTAHDFRATFVVANHDEAIHMLKNFSSGKSQNWVASNRVLGSDVSRDVVWVFSGHGAQWPDMGKELLKQPVFRETVIALDNVIYSEMGFSAVAALESGDLGGSNRIQVLTYVVQIGLAQLLQSKGAQPQAIIGHSVGEIAAAVAAGCLTAAEGAVIVSRRAKLYARVQGQGTMAMVSLPFAEVAQELGIRRDLVAAINSSPSTCVVSGDTAALEQYVIRVTRRGVRTWKVQTDIAFHSPLLESLAVPLQQSLEQSVNPTPANIPIYSTSNNDPRTATSRDLAYWTHNMMAPVRLVEAIDAALEDGFRIFLEISSHPIVSHSISETLATRPVSEAAVFGVMKRDTSSERSILQAISNLHTVGAQVDFHMQLGSSPWSTKVPNSPWVHKPYWKAISTDTASTVLQHNVDEHALLGGAMEVAGSNIEVWATILDDKSKPYPLTHPLDGTEIIPAAVYCNTILKATGATILDNVCLHVPLPMTTDKRNVQVIVQENRVRMLSRLQTSSEALNEHSWIEHSTVGFHSSDMTTFQKVYSVSDVKMRIGTRLPNNFAWDYLQKIGVSGIAFPWIVLEHYGNEKEMLVKMDMEPNSETMSWDAASWAPFLDAATSVGSSIFFKSVRMRIVSGIDKVLIPSIDSPPKIGWLFIEEASDGKDLKANISVLGEDGKLLAKLQGMRFSDVEAVNERRTSIDALVHRLAWVPPNFAEAPLPLRNVILISPDKRLADDYANGLEVTGLKLILVSSSKELREPDVLGILTSKSTLVAYAPGGVDRDDNVAQKAQSFLWETTEILRFLAAIPSSPKLFVITDNVQTSQSPTALAQAPLHGFARIAASEYPEIWGSLIDSEGPAFPLLAIKYVQDQSIIRMQDGLPRVPRLRTFTKEQRYNDKMRDIMPKPNGTYIVTGGFGDLGLEILEFLVNKGARRIVVVSRRPLPRRKDWPVATGQMANIVRKIQKLEAVGATIHAIALNIGSSSASAELLARLDILDLPPVLGVVHAAGVSGYGYIQDMASESLAEVMAPKVQGALNLHEAFPPNTLEFFLLFSSIGQLIGTPGQAAYASSNAFLDALATHRRAQGCNSVSVQWTAWRGLGLAADTALVDLELESKGVTDISVEEGFQAWEHLSQYDTDHAVVTRTRILDADETLPCSLIADIVQRRTRPSPSSSMPTVPSTESLPKTGPELKAHLSLKIRHSLSKVLHLDVEEIDDRAAIADLGVDSVMTVALRQQLQKAMGITVPPTLTWNCPTVVHLVGWFYEKLAEP